MPDDDPCWVETVAKTIHLGLPCPKRTGAHKTLSPSIEDLHRFGLVNWPASLRAGPQEWLIKSTQNIHQWLIVHVLRHVSYEIQMKKIRKMFNLAMIDYTCIWTADTGHTTKLISILKTNLPWSKIKLFVQPKLRWPRITKFDLARFGGKGKVFKAIFRRQIRSKRFAKHLKLSRN